MPVYEFECPDCGSRTEFLYVTSREADRALPCVCGSTQDRVPSTFSPDFKAPIRRQMAEQKLEMGTRDEIASYAARRKAEADARYDAQLAETVKQSVRDWDPGARYTITD